MLEIIDAAVGIIESPVNDIATIKMNPKHVYTIIND
jgi:hypothetical protein